MNEVTLSSFGTKLHFKRLKAEDIKKMPSFSLIEDGQLVGIVVIPASAEKRYQIECLCGQMDVARGVAN